MSRNRVLIAARRESVHPYAHDPPQDDRREGPRRPLDPRPHEHHRGFGSARHRRAPRNWCATTRSASPSTSRSTPIIWTERPLTDQGDSHGGSSNDQDRSRHGADANQPQPSAELTDGFHLVIDALKLNGVKTIYGVPGIPITDFGRMAQAAGIRVISFRHEQNAGNAAAIAGFLTKKPGICLTVSAPGFLNGLTALANATTNCFPMILISRLVRARGRRPAAGRLRGDGPARHRQAAVQGGVPRAACRRYRHRRGARDPRRRLRPSGRRLSRSAGQAFRPGDGCRGRREVAGQGHRSGAGADPGAGRGQARARCSRRAPSAR